MGQLVSAAGTLAARRAQRFTVYAFHEGRRVRGRRFTCRLLAEAEARRIEALRGLVTEVEIDEVTV